MDRFFRRLVGIAVLAALLVSMTHAVVAWRCMAHEMAAGVALVVDDGGSHGSHSAQHPPSSGYAADVASHHASHHGTPPDVPDHGCPHGPEGMTGGCAAVAVALPTPVATLASIPFGEQRLVALSDTVSPILLGTDLFRPPRC